jgi:hypothetical protein
MWLWFMKSKCELHSDERQSYWSFLFFEEPTVTCDTFLDMMENTTFYHVPMRTVFQLDGTPPHIFQWFHAFLDKEFPDHWMESGEPIPWPPCMIEFSELQSVLPMKCLPITGEKLNIISVCLATKGAHTET